MNKKGIIFIVSGCSGAGKRTVLDELFPKAQSLAYSVSATTRPPRPGERDGVDYHFISREEFEGMLARGELLEHTIYADNYYGTPKSELCKADNGDDLILEIELEGATNVKKLKPEAVSIFIAPPSREVLEDRLRSRGTNTEDDIVCRMKQAEVESAHACEYDYVVLNETGRADRAADDILAIICAEHCKTARNAELIGALTGKN